jgi:hypothetical protein
LCAVMRRLALQKKHDVPFAHSSFTLLCSGITPGELPTLQQLGFIGEGLVAAAGAAPAMGAGLSSSEQRVLERMRVGCCWSGRCRALGLDKVWAHTRMCCNLGICASCLRPGRGAAVLLLGGLEGCALVISVHLAGSATHPLQETPWQEPCPLALLDSAVPHCTTLHGYSSRFRRGLTPGTAAARPHTSR